jgi:hypothetical protein
MAETTFENKVGILADLFIDYKDNEDFADFVEYNDIGLPLAYIVASGLAKIEPRGKTFIEETFVLLLASLEIDEDTGFDSLEDLFIFVADN